MIIWNNLNEIHTKVIASLMTISWILSHATNWVFLLPDANVVVIWMPTFLIIITDSEIDWKELEYIELTKLICQKNLYELWKRFCSKMLEEKLHWEGEKLLFDWEVRKKKKQLRKLLGLKTSFPDQSEDFRWPFPERNVPTKHLYGAHLN